MHDIEDLNKDAYIGIDNSEDIAHYGVKRRSGRYPWGSGKEPYQHSSDFLRRVEELSKTGTTEQEICKALGMTSTDFRMQLRVAKHERKALLIDKARSLKEDGLSTYKIAEQLGLKNESTVRSMLAEKKDSKKNLANNTAEVLIKQVEKKGVIDVGESVERHLGVSRGVLDEAIFIATTKGYVNQGMGVQQVTNKKQQTNMNLLMKPDIELKDVYANPGLIKPVTDFHSKDGGETFKQLQYPASIDSNRVHIRYNEAGGLDRDGTIEIRRGVADLSLGNSNYAQVRILVDGTHYLKGMALYSDNLPPGKDIVYNTNKHEGTPKEKVFKEIKKDDPTNPFGAYISADGQSTYIGKDGKEHLSAINKLKQEGDWSEMNKALSSQFLSKQPMKLINQQLDATYSNAVKEYEDICKLTNPTVKRKMLYDLADQFEGAACHLKAAALPRQNTQVILPMPHLKDNEIYAPNYKNGETVSLVRFPHGGTFEIPQLVVNNKNVESRKILPPTAKDAVGINHRVADRLSGADFDGDTVLVIPTNSKAPVKSTKPLKELEGFDTKEAYGPHTYENKKNVRIMSKENTQMQMGAISNLITDMTLQGAPLDHMARAVKHSMVVIDANKHKLDYKQSEKDNGIAELKQLYQGRYNEEGKWTTGAATLFSRRKQTVYVDERKGSAQIQEDGSVKYKTSGREYKDANGNIVKAQQKVKLLQETKDLRTLSSGTDQEEAYAAYGNKMKLLAMDARKTAMATGNLKMNPQAKKIYAEEVKSLDNKLNIAMMNAPKERQAQAIANSQIKALIQSNPDLSKKENKKELMKISQQRLLNARIQVGADSKGSKIDITDKEWSAIQAGAVSDSKLMSILRKADEKKVRELATPRDSKTLNDSKVNRVKSLKASGKTNAEIAEALGISVSTVSKLFNS